MGLSQEQFFIQMYGIGGLKLSLRRKLHSVDARLAQANIVVIDVVSNDLCDPL